MVSPAPGAHQGGHMQVTVSAIWGASGVRGWLLYVESRARAEGTRHQFPREEAPGSDPRVGGSV